jgi:hypothetical protein
MRELIMRDEQATENEIQAKGLNAPRLTPALIDSKIKSTDYFVFPGTMLTVCAMTLTNGFTVVGESACASPENFNKEIGRNIAYENARQKIWALEGYLLRERLAYSRLAGHGEYLSGLAAVETRPAGGVGGGSAEHQPLAKPSDIVRRDFATECWRDARGEVVPDSEVVRTGVNTFVRMKPDVPLGDDKAGKLLGDDHSEDGAPSFKG